MYKLDEVIKNIEKDFPAWIWLVRRDHDNGYFANLMSPNLEHTSASVAQTPADALQRSYEEVTRWQASQL